MPRTKRIGQMNLNTRRLRASPQKRKRAVKRLIEQFSNQATRASMENTLSLQATGKEDKDALRRKARAQNQVAALYRGREIKRTWTYPRTLEKLHEMNDMTLWERNNQLLENDPVVQNLYRLSSPHSTREFFEKAFRRALTKEEYLRKARQRFKGAKRATIERSVNVVKESPKSEVRRELVKLRRSIKRRLMK